MPVSMPLSAETHLVFGCARMGVEGHATVTADGEAPPARELARAVTSWDAVGRLAVAEGALPLLWRALRAHADVVPPEVAAYLKNSAMLSDFRMQLLAQRTQETVRALAASNVPVLLLKGAAVGAMTDPSFRSRPMGDVDVLVRPDDVARAQDILLASGWAVTGDAVVRRLLQDRHHLPHFVRDDLPGMRLELHTLALPPEHPFALERDWLWAGALPANAPYAGALIPAPVLGALHACIHFAWQHRLRAGAWRTMRSLAVLARQPGFSWDALVAAALPARAGTSVYWSLRLAESLGAIEVPADVLRRLAPPTAAWVNRALERHFITEIAAHEGPTNPSVRLGRLLWEAALRPAWSGHPPHTPVDEAHDWDIAYGRKSDEGAMARALRHLREYRRWMAFASHLMRR